jgi:MOSC domain-containing protein YiiM
MPSHTIQGTLESVNVAKPENVPYRGRMIRTGINKMPVRGPVMVRRVNLDGDAQADLRVHGGPDKAIYVYASENYALWRNELGWELPYGHFGENLTTTGLLEKHVHIGDLLLVGQAVLQVTQPRFPCYKLGNKWEICAS